MSGRGWLITRFLAQAAEGLVDPFPVVGNVVGFGEEMTDWVLDMLSVKGLQDRCVVLEDFMLHICFVI